MKTVSVKLNDLLEQFDKGTSDKAPEKIAILVGMAAVGLSFLFYAPMLWAWNMPFFEASRTGDFMRLCEDPLRRDLVEPILAYRFVVPVICHALGLTGFYSFIPQFAANIVAHALIYLTAANFYSRGTALLATLLISTSYVAIISNGWMGVPDSVTLMCLGGLLWRPNWIASWILIYVGACNDERMWLGVPFVVGWWWFHLPTRRHWLVVAVSSAIGGLLWWLTRKALTLGLVGPGIERPAVYSDFWNLFISWDPTTHTWPLFVTNVIWGYRWIWGAVVFFSIWATWPSLQGRFQVVSAKWLGGLAALGGILALTGAGDVARGTAFLYPGVLLALCWVRERGPAEIRNFAVWLLPLQLVTPAIYFGTAAVLQINLPLPLVLLRWWLGTNPLW